MPNDAKVGLVLGVVVVVIVAVVFFRQDAAQQPYGAAAVPAVVGHVETAPRDANRPVAVQPTALSGASRATALGPRHTVQEGDSLFSLAERYYGDKQRFTEIYLANRSALRSPDRLTPGTELVIPGAPEKQEELVEGGGSGGEAIDH